MVRVMSVERPGFWRRHGDGEARGSDIAVAGRRRLWAMSAVIVASSAALLGTSDDDGGPDTRGYVEFAKLGIDGGEVELTKDAPTATFFVKITATELGVGDIVTTDRARAILDGMITASGLNAGESQPFVAVKVSSSTAADPFEQRVLDGFHADTALGFTGNCENPATGAACVTQLAVTVARIDDGAAGGSLRFDWSFDLKSSGDIAPANMANVEKPTGVQELPWTVEVSGP